MRKRPVAKAVPDPGMRPPYVASPTRNMKTIGGAFNADPKAQMALDRAGPGSRPTAYGPLDEIGVTGLLQTSGFIFEEFLPQLQGDKALQVYLEMQQNSPTVQGVLYAIDMLCRQVDWRTEPGGTAPEDIKAAEFVESLRADMSHSWEDFISEVLSMLAFGWSYHEIVYKTRSGPDPLHPGRSSQYDDGLIGWRKLPVRAQITRWRWEFDPEGGVKGMWQAPWGLGGGLTTATALRYPVYIPIEKALLFRPRAHKNNPQGVSLLRAAYRPWYFAKRLEEVEAIGVDRDLTGLPMVRIPSEHIAGNTQTFQNWKKMVRNVRRGEQEGIVLPSDRDATTNEYLYDFSLLTTGGRRQIDIGAIIERHDRRIALTMLADFLFLGQGGQGGRGGGSYALSESRSELFSLALGTILDSIASVLNRYAIPRILTLNGMEVEHPPTFTHSDVSIPDMQGLADAMLKFSQAGMPLFPDVGVENVLRSYLGMPELTDDEITARRTQEAAAPTNGAPPTDGQEPSDQPPSKPTAPTKSTAPVEKRTPE